VLPLSGLRQGPIETQHIAGQLFTDRVSWDAGGFGSSGTTLFIYEKPRPLPFLRHDLQRVVFDNRKCASSEAFAVLQPDGRHVIARCPWNEYEHKQGYHDFLVPLP
jgi:hypothetical protein